MYKLASQANELLKMIKPSEVPIDEAEKGEDEMPEM
jgi:hypothetical protein